MNSITGSVFYSQRLETAIWLLLNLYPVVGVLYFDWNVFALFYVFWLETVAMTFFTTLRILGAQAGGSPKPAFRIAFRYFIVRMFMLFFYLMFIVVFIGIMMASQHEKSYEWLMYFAFIDKSFKYSMIFYFVITSIFFWGQYVHGKEYLKTDPEQFKNILFDGRMMIIHIVLILGFFAFMFIEQRIGTREGLVAFTIVFVALKWFIGKIERKQRIIG
jgi:hypothetical protein